MKDLTVTRTEIPAHAQSAPTAVHWREAIAGALIALGICGPFILPAILPLRWWMVLPCAMAGGVLRWQHGVRLRTAQLPLIGLFLLVALYAVGGYLGGSVPDYGVEKTMRFLALGGVAFCAFAWQAPLTRDFMRGMRGMLLCTLLLGLVLVVLKRDLFLQTEEMGGVAQLTESFSLIGLPLAIAMAATCLIPSTLAPQWLLTASAALLGVGVIEILLRGRYDAMAVCAVAVLLVLGPPWRALFWRLMVAGLLAVGAAWAYVNVLPLLGYSFRYLTWMEPETLGGRAPLFMEAWRGFLEAPLGHGIGSFVHLEPFYLYPHNIVLESAYELGLPGLLCILGIYYFVVRRVWTLWLSPPHRVPAALLFLIFVHMLKAGDIATLAFQWVALYQLIVVTPVDSEWSRATGEAVR